MKKPVFIIAEAGVNHNGDPEIAIKLIDCAARAGASAIKFQTFKASKLLTKNTPKAAYQEATTGGGNQYEMIQRLELDETTHHTLIRHCKQRNIEFMSTPFDHDSIDLLDRLGVKRFKVGSGDLTNLPYLRHMAKTGKEIILSTGMATLTEVQSAVKTLFAAGYQAENLVLLHANTEYPTPYEDVNLLAMATIRDKFSCRVGYSDHTRGIEVPVAAVALGAEVIEKHFTIDRNMEGPDHKASLEPEELYQMVNSIRHIEQSLGDGVKEPSESEKNNMAVARKSIVAACVIKKGERFTEDMLCVKRPGTGISPLLWDQIIGTLAKKDYEPDELIS